MNELRVRVDFGQEALDVGTLLQQGKSIFFRYHAEYLETGYNISPFKLQWNAEIQKADVNTFDGLFGVFADSLPDGWGRLLLDRQLLRLGRNLAEVNPLERLAYVGAGGKGALTYHPTQKLWQDFQELRLQLDELAQQATEVLQDREIDALPELLRLGGSSGGARPKIHVLYQEETGLLRPDAQPPLSGFTPWIIKFAAREDGADAARMEMAYAEAARRAGLEMAACRLFTGRSDNLYFGTRRFDRAEAGQRIHLHGLAGLLHDNFRLPSLDYGHVMDAAFRLEQDVRAYQKVLRLAAFNVFTHNRDDHTNNLSFLMEANGRWRLAPVYDLTFSNPGHGEHSITIAGEGRSPDRKNLRELASHFSVPRVESILDQVWEATRLLPEAMREMGVSTPVTEALRRHQQQFE